jgi:hypothetical protein
MSIKRPHIVRSANDKALRPRNTETQRDTNLLLTTNQIAGALILFVDMGVMFATRDWSVAGTMSAMAGAIGMVASG